MNRNLNIRKLSGKDRFEIDFIMAYIPMTFLNDFDKETSRFDLNSARIFGSCF